jgi:hypothetical protein
MRIDHVILAGSVAALAMLTAPALAKHPDHAQKSDEKSSPSCHSYQMAADGSWTALPCEEIGAPAHGQRKPAPQSPDEPAR